MPTSSTTKISAPKSRSTVAPRKAMTQPTMKLSSITSGTASRPTCSMWCTVEVTRRREGWTSTFSAVVRVRPRNPTSASTSRVTSSAA